MEVNMGKVQTIAIIAGLLLSMTVMAENKQTGNVGNKIRPLPRDMEIQLALSSLPSHLRENATVYVLNPDRGFEIAREGSNGFHTLVDRIDPGAFRGSWPYTEYRDDILVPISFDSAGAKEHMRVIMDSARMRAEGTPPAELKKIINQRFRTGHYGTPERAGISYMLSPMLRAYQNPDKSDKVMTFNYPHYMFYAPGVSNEDIGGEMLSPHLFIINHGPHGYMIKGVGLTEKAVINKEYEELIERLCELRTVYCLPEQTFQ
jgi:hypothetical protein